MHRSTTEERRRRLLRRHHFAPEAHAPALAALATDLVGVHSSDPATVFLAGRARLADPSVAAMERELYDEPTVVRMHGMRRTLFVQALPSAPVVHSAVTRAVAVQERRRVEGMLLGAGITDDPRRWLATVERETLEALSAAGEASLVQLGANVPRLRERIRFAVGKAYEGELSVGTRLLMLLAMEAKVVRGRPLGTWISSQYRWLPVERLFPDGMPGLPEDEARTVLVGRWLATHGPGTLRDIRWWSGLTVAAIRAALDALDAVEVTLDDGATGWALPDDLAPEVVPTAPSARFLPSLDPTVMGWADRAFYLGDQAQKLFDTNGNAGPTVWWDGRVVGGWGQRADGEVAWVLLEDVGVDGRAAIEAEAAALQAWLGPVRITPRFRTPIDRELRGDGPRAEDGRGRERGKTG